MESKLVFAIAFIEPSGVRSPVFYFYCSMALLGPPSGDSFPNFASLSERYEEGVHFRIVERPGSAPVSVLAIHGGGLEPGTSELAKRIAQRDFNLYSFEALLPDPHLWIVGSPNLNQVFHITSHKFDEPRALSLVQDSARSQKCLSIHGSKGDGTPAVCIGGRDVETGTRIASALGTLFASNPAFHGWSVEHPCVRYPAKHSQNIVNRCVNGGVQLEITNPGRRLLEDDAGLRDLMAETIRGCLY